MMTQSRFSGFGILSMLTVTSSFTGCGGTTTGNPLVDTSSTSEIAISTVSGAANASEPGGTQASYELRPRGNPLSRLAASLLEGLSPLQTSYAATACPTIADTGCSSGVITLNYLACTYGLSPTEWNGSQVITFSGGCPSPVHLAQFNSKTLTRTFGAGTSETNLFGVKTTLDTTNAPTSGWDSSVTIATGGEQAQFTDTTGGRTLTILGIHLHAAGSGGTTLLDHTVSSTGLTISGSGTSRSIASGGTITVQHNLKKYTAQVQITSPLLYSSAGCCHPASGSVTTTLSGSVSSLETLTFTGGKCGAATLTDSSGTTSSVSLSHCF